MDSILNSRRARGNRQGSRTDPRRLASQIAKLDYPNNVSVGFEPEEVESLRIRLRKMTDRELIQFGEAARYMSSPKANHGDEPLAAFVTQLNEARAEWRRRHPRGEGKSLLDARSD